MNTSPTSSGLFRYMVKTTPAIIIIHAPTSLIIPVARRRKLIMTCRPRPTETVTTIIKIKSPSINPLSPIAVTEEPFELKNKTKGSTAAAVQSIEAAA